MDDSDEEKLFGAGGESSSSDSDSSDSESGAATKGDGATSAGDPVAAGQSKSEDSSPAPEGTLEEKNKGVEEKVPTKDEGGKEGVEKIEGKESKDQEDEDEETKRLFGADDESSSSSSSDSEDDSAKGKGKTLKVKRKDKEGTVSKSNGEKEAKKAEEEVEEEEIVVEPTLVEVPELPRLKETSEVRFSRLPNLLHLAPCAFDADTYREEQENKQLKKLGKELVGDNVIRWRYKTDAIKQKVVDEETGLPVLESNARFVEWSDGSVQLLLGEETFEVLSQPAQGQFLYAMSVDTKNDKTFLEAHGKIKADLRFRPTSLASTAHKDLELRVKGKNLKSTKLLQTAVLVDPEREQEERAKAREAALRLKERQRAKNEYEYGKRAKNKQWNKNFLEEGSSQQEYDDEEEYGTSVKAIKEKYRGKSRAQRAFSSSDSSEDDDDDRNAAKRRKTVAERKVAESSKPRPAEPSKEEEKKAPPPEPEEKHNAESSGKAPVASSSPSVDMEDKDEDIVQVSKKRRVNLIDSDSE